MAATRTPGGRTLRPLSDVAPGRAAQLRALPGKVRAGLSFIDLAARVLRVVRDAAAQIESILDERDGPGLVLDPETPATPETL